MRKYTIIAEEQQIELNNISLMGLVYECAYMTPEEFDAIAYLAVGSSVTFDPKYCNASVKYKVIRTE